ncbi:MAG: DegV family EDD domain-containing protein [Clostridia bacterium]|nr:DegV family EDD domain-containing protein [Clostridia bacterium]
MKIAVSVESTSDLSQSLLSKYDVKVIPYQISIGDNYFKDGELSTEEIFAEVDKTGVLPKTTALNEFEYTEYFEELLKEYDAVVHVCLSSGLSSSCGNAFAAANNVKNVFVVDSKSLSTGIGLLAIYARELANQGVEPKDIQEKVQARAEKLQVSFIVERLDYLYKGGRCNAMALLGANIFHIRPRIVVKDGKMGSDKKYRGPMGKVIEKYCNEVLEEFDTPDLDKVFITYTSATPEMLDAAEKACQNAGFKQIYKTFAGGTIASHCGAHTLGILYFNDGE